MIGGVPVELRVKSVEFGTNGHFWTADLASVSPGEYMTINLTPSAEAVLANTLAGRWDADVRGDVMRRYAEQYVADKGFPSAPISIGTTAAAEIRITDVTAQTTLRDWALLR
jgi:hypothetical protein